MEDRTRALPGRPAVTAWEREPALVVGGRGDLRERLVADLTLLGHRPVVYQGHGVSPGPSPPWVVLLVTEDQVEEAAGRSQDLRRIPELRSVPLLWLIRAEMLALVSGFEQLCDDFVGLPYSTEELAIRLRLLRWRAGMDGPEIIRRGQLTLNLATYRAALAGRAMDLTYMEYELLKLLSRNPGRVFTREEILSRVWGYDYFGGMRTVDVHVRRLRAKLGQEYAWLIETVRSVGYRFAHVC